MARRFAPPPLHAGNVLSSRFRLIKRLANGSSATVWQATDELLGRQVAIKALNPRVLHNRAGRARLHLEAQALASLCHPHIAIVYDFATTPNQSGQSTPYLVMELVDGVTLASFDQLPWPAAVTVAAQTASAIAAAHDKGLVHRDVSAANVLLTADGVKVVDFGICALEGDRDANRLGGIVGTPAYIAPERIARHPVGPAVDVYAVGVLLYYSLAGRWPWPASGTEDFLVAHRKTPPLALEVPDLPAPVSQACLSCLDKDPQRRPTAAELADLLAPFADPASIQGLLHTEVALHHQPTQPLASAGDTVVKARRRKASSSAVPRHRRAAAAVASTAAAIAAVTLTGWSPTTVPTEPQAAGPAAAAPPPSECLVSYHATPVGKDQFSATITVTNTGAAAWSPGWQLSAVIPEQHHIDPAPGWQHSGSTVTSPAGPAIPPGHAAVLTITGRHQTALAAPPQWQLDGKSCAASAAIAAPPAVATGNPTPARLVKHQPTAKTVTGKGKDTGRNKATSGKPAPKR